MTAVIVVPNKHKAADPGSLVAELFKYAVRILPGHQAKDSVGRSENILTVHLTALFNNITRTGLFQDCMTQNDLISMFKEGV